MRYGSPIEWQRRVVAIGYAAVASCTLGAINGLPLWIVVIFGLAILVFCFRLADMISDEAWPRWSLKLRYVHGLYLLLAIGLLMLFGGRAH